PSPDVELFKRAGILLAVTAWESFIEDTIADEFDRRLKAAQTPKDVEGAFHSVAERWLSRQPRPPELVAWTSDGWKGVMKAQLAQDIDELHTPNAKDRK